MRALATVLFVHAFAAIALATWQECDILKYDGDTFYTPVFPLETCKTYTTGTNTFHATSSANCRDYVAVWEVVSNKLYLVNIGRQGSNIDWIFPHEWATLEVLFPGKAKSGRIYADWFTGNIFSPGRRWGEFLPKEDQSKQEAKAQLIISVKDGNVVAITDKRTPGKASEQTR